MCAMPTPDDENQRLQCDEADIDLIAKVRARLAERDRAIEVDIDALDTETPGVDAHQVASGLGPDFEGITPENSHGLLLEGDAEGDEAW